jgi:retron-type reverse transcriptase
VRPEGANHQWRKTPPGELSIYLEADKRLDRVTGWAEPLVEPCFHEGSYGYRPGKSALDAVGVARQRCWRYARVLDLDLQSFFDQIVSKLLMRGVRKHTDCPWVLLYIERWLQAPV